MFVGEKKRIMMSTEHGADLHIIHNYTTGLSFSSDPQWFSEESLFICLGIMFHSNMRCSTGLL